MSSPDRTHEEETTNDSYDEDNESNSDDYVSDLVDDNDAGKVYDEEEWNTLWQSTNRKLTVN